LKRVTDNAIARSRIRLIEKTFMVKFLGVVVNYLIWNC